jgi:iron complex outermembrane receptor protein
MTKLIAQRALTRVAALGSLALVSSTAFSQATPIQTAAATPTSGGLEEIVVTARYRQENLQQTPIAITAITAEDVEQRGFTNTSEIAYSVPNASFRPAQAAFGNTQTAFIRGIGQNDFDFAFEPGVGIYVDDVYYPTTMASQFDLLDLERVEVLRGPQGTLFGRGSIGGAIRYVSKQPRGDNTGYAEVTVGEFHRVDVRAGYDFSLIPDKLFVRITGVSRKEDGYQKDIDFACKYPQLSGSLPKLVQNRDSGCQLGTLGGTDLSGARAQLRYVVSDALDFGMALDYQRDDSEARADTLLSTGRKPFAGGTANWDQFMFDGTITTPAGIVRPNPNFFGYGVHYDDRFLPPNPFVSYATFTDPYSGLASQPKTSLNQKGISGTMNWKINDLVSAKVILAWRNWNGHFATDQDVSPLGFSVADGRQSFTYRTAELQLSGQLIQKLNWTAGGFFYSGNSNNAETVELPAFGNLMLYGSDPTGYTVNPGTGESLPNSLLVDGLRVGHAENKSGFVHATYDLTDALQFELGGRYSDDQKHENFDNTIFRVPVQSNQTRFDWRAGVNYKFTSSILAYGTASTGYRPPAFNPRPFQATQFVPVKGENMTAYELGIKSDWLDRRLRLNVAGFYSDYKQRIVPQGGIECLKNADGSVVPGPIPNPQGGSSCLAILPLTRYVNSPGKIKGFEVESEFRPIDPLLFSASVGRTDFTASNSTTGGILPNGEPAYVPKWNASASVQYTLTLANGATISPRYDAYLQTQICSFQSTVNAGCTAGYTLMNGRVEYASNERTWTAAVGVENLTNKVYFLNVFDLSNFGEPTVEGQPGKPRTWYLTVRRNFR